MKRIFLCSIGALTMNAPAFSQWVISGGNASLYNSGNATQVVVGSTATGKTYGAFATSQDANGYVSLHSVSASGSTYGNLILNQGGGNVGVGTTSPSDKLHVANGGIKVSNTGFSGLKLYNSADNTEKMHVYWRPTDDVIELNTGAGSGRQMSFVANGVEGVRINADGNVAIGLGAVTFPVGYKLAVNGAAVATSMKVKLSGNWPDFVFLKDYKLPTLPEVKSYINENGHLPDMPSADEVHTNGLDLGEMNRLLLKKVEELTLYLIEKNDQDKQKDAKLALEEKLIEQQLNNIKQQEARISALEALILK